VNLELDHFFILTDKPKQAGDLLVSMGLNESFSRDHQGQGTSNRRFIFSNGMLEILYLRDTDEFNNGPAKYLRFAERLQQEKASPFGLVLKRVDDSQSEMPFKGWSYQPAYFEPPNAFHIGDNSDILEEPLCIYAPFISPMNRKVDVGEFKSLSEVQITVPSSQMSHTLQSIQTTNRLKIELGREHVAKLIVDDGRKGLSKDLRPTLPLIISC